MVRVSSAHRQHSANVISDPEAVNIDLAESGPAGAGSGSTALGSERRTFGSKDGGRLHSAAIGGCQNNRFEDVSPACLIVFAGTEWYDAYAHPHI